MTREANSKADQSNTPEQQKKLQDKVEKCKQDVQKVRTVSTVVQLHCCPCCGLVQHRAVETDTTILPPPFIPISLSLIVCTRLQAVVSVSRAEILPSPWGKISPASSFFPMEALSSRRTPQHGDPWVSLALWGGWGAQGVTRHLMYPADSGEVREGSG